MTPTPMAFLTVLGLLWAMPLVAHEGHGEISILTGTVRSVQKDRIEIEIFDQSALQRKTVWILLDEKTKFLIGKNRVERLELAFGHRVESAVRSEHARDSSIQLRAVQIKLNETKKLAPATR